MPDPTAPHTLDIPTSDDQRLIAEMFHRQKLDHRLLGIPSRFREGFEGLRRRHPSMRPHCDWVQGWAQRLDTTKAARGLFMSGPFGSGKTGLAWGIARALMERRVPVLVWYVPDLMRALKASWDDETAPSEATVMDLAIGAPLLILDDLGSETTSQWGVGTLTQIVNHRYEDEKPVVVTSNLSPAGLLAHTKTPGARAKGVDYNAERIASRLGEMCEELVLDGGDLRANAAREASTRTT